MDELSRKDWQYIHYAVQRRFDEARPKGNEGKPSKEFLEQEDRIMLALTRKAFS